MDDHNAPTPVDDGRAALLGHGLALHQPRPLQVDDESGDQPAPEPAGCVGHAVAPADTVGGRVDDLEAVSGRRAPSQRGAKRRPLRQLLALGGCGLGPLLGGQAVDEVDGRTLHGEHARDEPLVVPQGQGDLKPLQQLQVLKKILGREAPVVPENEGHVGLLEDAVVDKVLSLRDGDHLCQQVCQPHRVDEVEVVQTPEVVVVVEEDSVVMEELGSCGDGASSQGRLQLYYTTCTCSC